MEENYEEETEEEKAEVQRKNRAPHLLPYQYKKGQSGNPSGRPKGISFKEYLKVKFRSMTPDEREEFLEGIDKYKLLELAEGKPESKTDITSDGKAIRGNTIILSDYDAAEGK